MNFNFIAALLAVCVSFAVAVPEGNDHLAQAPPVKHSKKTAHHGSKSSSVSKHGKSVSSSASKHGKSLSSSRFGKSSVISTSSFSPVPRSSSSLQFASEIHDASKKCARQLEAILYSPPSTVKDYLAKIANEMRTDIQVIMAAFAGGNLDYIRTYVNRYNILVTIAGPFGLPVLVGPTIIAYTEPLKNVATAQTYTGRDGFYADSRNFYYNYQFSMMSSNGQYITFILSLPLSAMTNSPTKC